MSNQAPESRDILPFPKCAWCETHRRYAEDMQRFAAQCLTFAIITVGACVVLIWILATVWK